MPKISVIVPTYNCARYLPEAINSALQQTYEDIEVIIIDDGSNDNTREISDTYVQNNPNKVRYINNKKNKGLSAARNIGIMAATGEYVAFLDADDIYLPGMLEKTTNVLLKNKAYDLVITEWLQVVIDDNGSEISREIKVMSGFPSSQQELYKMLFTDFIFHYSMVVKKAYICKVGCFDENIFFGEDIDLWRRFAQYGVRIGLIKEPLYIYRKRENSLTTSLSFKKLNEQFKLVKKYEKDIIAQKYLKEYYAEYLWDLGRKAFYLKSSLYFIFKCLIKSQLYSFSFLRICRAFGSTIKVSKLSHEKSQ